MFKTIGWETDRVKEVLVSLLLNLQLLGIGIVYQESCEN